MVEFIQTLKGGDKVQELKQKAIMKATRVGILATLSMPALARADHNNAHVGAKSAQPGGTPNQLGLTGDGIFKEITNTLILIVGAVAVLMLIIGGLRYVLSGGNSSNVESAKNTIFYAIIGIVVAILAYAIVNFVIDSIR